MSWIGTIYFFDSHIKPHILKGTRNLHPNNTQILNDGLACIREGDVNLWFYTKNNRTLAIDAGHLNEPDIAQSFKKIKIDPTSIKHVLITHSDVDHCGGIDIKNKANIYPNAKVYLSRLEEAYLKHDIHRMVKLGKKIYNCVELKDYILVDDNQELELDGFKIKCILVPGHTIGHMCFIVDDFILFSGDCLAINQNGGYAFWDFFCQDPNLNKESLKKLKLIVEQSNIKYCCSGHSGITTDIPKLFKHIDESASFSRKVAFDESAPIDVCKR